MPGIITAAMQTGGFKNRNVAINCALASAALEGNCGIVALVFAILHRDLPTSALEVFCDGAGDSLVCTATRFCIGQPDSPTREMRCLLCIEAGCSRVPLTDIRIVPAPGQAACAELEVSEAQASSLSLSVGAACKLESKASFGCTCPTQNHADCDCTGTAYQAVVEIWPIAMTVLGAAGAH